ncbi:MULTISPECIES: peptidoglycan-binding protein [Alicyclobacillus]|uniref:Peptidoglycan-binding protein n=2 Tax=Alicyclobacillus acidoterrestris TaxID=1450 RepID=T0CQR3_ALIAG|nr:MULTISPECIES: peptidoglycan-binding protein [Alicyclobacillus]EPZ41812.1 hypothetical protein N007_16615 [Alicyclobacillus acidoterrestris ATCC 49025]UNO49576.1 peptidoglycan-binding protein [Alicyclobacillus acidoterrestris]
MNFKKLLAASSVPMLLTVAAPVAVYAQTEPTISYGSVGSAVTTLQKDLKSLGYSVGPIDGDFGPKTLSAVKSFQQAHKLTVDGVVGPQTWSALQSATHGASFTNVDLRYSAPSDINTKTINSFLSKNGSPMNGLGQSFMNAQSTYGVDANYLVSHAILESAWGKSQIALAKNNLFGYGAYDSNPGDDAGMFPSDSYAIMFQAWEVRNNYLNPGSSEYVTPTLTGMNVHYATDPNWASSIGSLMNELASSAGGNVNQYQQYPSTAIVSQPKSNAEPVYYVNGAAGTTQQNPYYGGVPYFSSLSDGMSDMFFGPLQNGSSGSGVSKVQRYLNQQIGAGLTVDGQYGPATAAAVKKFEAKHGLKQDGVWSFAMWTKYIYTASTPTVPAGSSVEIDQIAQGMAGAYVVPWYHIAGEGWVDSQYVKLTNVYRLTVANPTSTNTSIPVYSSSDKSQQIETLHSGDFVVANSTQASNGMYEIQLSAQMSDASGQAAGTPMTGYVSTSTAKMTAQH